MSWQIIWGDLFALSANPIEIILRGSLMFGFLFIIFRFILRRDIGNIGIGDFLFVAIVADASQNSMSSDYHSITDGFLLVVTLAFWNYLLDFLSYRYTAIRRLVEPGALPLVKNGKLQRNNLRRQFITPDEIDAKLREQGIRKLSQVIEMRLEADGEISVVHNDKP